MATTPTPIGEQLYNNFENNILPSYRAANLVFAYYAAFPLVFSPDMLYQLWLNFQDYQECQANEAQIATLPMVVVSDLLQSGMCQEVAFELYELHEEVAAYLKNNIQQLLHAKNIELLYNHKDIAAFTLGYANQYLQHPNRRNLFDIYYWKSLFEAYPEQASQEIKTAIEKPHIANSDTQNTLYLALSRTASRSPLAQKYTPNKRA
ncbi:MAG: hypothetical protein IPN94_25450 [Sphingobacteriales bacterium]|nr:hypothetical protein [Sphingobacteriales bacterium]